MSFLQSAVREALSNPKSANDVKDATGWDASSVSRFLSGGAGVPLEKLDALLSAVGFVAVSARYLDALGTMSEVGTHCRCARQGMGECHPSTPKLPK